MSTRDSIVYVAGLHIYVESNSGDICLDFDALSDALHNIDRKRNEKYDDPIITRSELIEIHQRIGKFLYGENRRELGND